MDRVIKGFGVSEGVGIGRLLVVKPEIVPVKALIQDAKLEVKKLKSALEKSLTELDLIFWKKLSSLGDDKAQIFQAHMMILQDPEWIKDIEKESMLNHVTQNMLF